MPLPINEAPLISFESKCPYPSLLENRLDVCAAIDICPSASTNKLYYFLCSLNLSGVLSQLHIFLCGRDGAIHADHSYYASRLPHSNTTCILSAIGIAGVPEFLTNVLWKNFSFPRNDSTNNNSDIIERGSFEYYQFIVKTNALIYKHDKIVCVVVSTAIRQSKLHVLYVSTCWESIELISLPGADETWSRKYFSGRSLVYLYR